MAVTQNCSRSLYRPRKPQQTPYYQALQQHGLTWIHAREPAAYVSREITDYLRCGIPTYGFARAVCHHCSHNFYLSFSCKLRTCPSCATRRMDRIAAHAVDSLLPRVPLRQWVLSVPKRLRPALQYNTALNDAVLSIITSELSRLFHELCPEAPDSARIGAMSFIQRFGSFLNPHQHYHLCICDGLFACSPRGHLQFFEPLHISAYHIKAAEERMRRRILILYVRHGLLSKNAASAMRHQANSGFSLDGSVRIHNADRDGAERVIRYCARPAFAASNLKWIRPGELLFYRFPKVDIRGRKGLYLHPIQLLDHIANLIPPPRAHLNHYHGAFAGNSPLRRYVTAYADRPITQHYSPTRDFAAHVRTQRRTPASYTWAELIERIFETNPLECPQCRMLLRIVDFITEAELIHQILSEMGLPTEPPYIEPARNLPLLELNGTRLVYDESKDLLIEMDGPDNPFPDYENSSQDQDVQQSGFYGDIQLQVHETTDPFPDYENMSQEPTDWHNC